MFPRTPALPLPLVTYCNILHRNRLVCHECGVGGGILRLGKVASTVTLSLKRLPRTFEIALCGHYDRDNWNVDWGGERKE